ncbi:hypothetical protein PHPALM_30507 [Phytophthora palmivora]|uniref:Uncharacterized protein n=1 Tax=Phytophthora palmivora TaxID=4796 RepID=A0A2P4X4X9_9STRA|nr:hypothetical protein PHPALM_30507 [Phytophthora palmivora]
MSGEINSDALREMSVTEYPCLKKGYDGPSPAIKRAGDFSLTLFLFCLPVSLWNEITSQSKRYHFSMINEGDKARYGMDKKKKPVSAKAQGDFKAALMQLPPIRAVDILHMMGLLIARATSRTRRNSVTTGNPLTKAQYLVEALGSMWLETVSGI